MEQGDTYTPVKRRDATSSSPSTHPGAIVKSVSIAVRTILQNRKDCQRDKSGRWPTSGDLKDLSVYPADAVFEYPCQRSRAVHGWRRLVTCFDAMLLKGFRTSAALQQAITGVVGVVESSGTMLLTGREADPAHFEGNLRAVEWGGYSAINMAHEGVESVRDKAWPHLAGSNVWPTKAEMVRALQETRGQNLEAQTQLEWYVPNYDQDAVLHNGGPCRYMDPVSPEFMEVYRHTLPSKRQAACRGVLRYRRTSRQSQAPGREILKKLLHYQLATRAALELVDDGAGLPQYRLPLAAGVFAQLQRLTQQEELQAQAFLRTPPAIGGLRIKCTTSALFGKNAEFHVC